ncbi:hypothetical protein ACSG6T_002692 [Enterococcus faecalis]
MEKQMLTSFSDHQRTDAMKKYKIMELIQLASQWFYDAGRLPSSAWAQVTYGDVAVDSIRKILSSQSEPYYFGGVGVNHATVHSWNDKESFRYKSCKSV